MEIERKFLVPCLPEGYDAHPFHQIEQAYLCTEPVVRIRQEDDSFYLTYKGKGLLSREEYNLPLTREAYAHLLPKADGTPHYVMDLLERSGLDFKHVQRPVVLQVNGADCLFQQVLQPGDRVSIGYEDEVNAL